MEEVHVPKGSTQSKRRREDVSRMDAGVTTESSSAARETDSIAKSEEATHPSSEPEAPAESVTQTHTDTPSHRHTGSKPEAPAESAPLEHLPPEGFGQRQPASQGKNAEGNAELSAVHGTADAGDTALAALAATTEERRVAIRDAEGKEHIVAVPKVPVPFPLKKIPGRVMLEEDYVESMETLIQRDYFPDLPRLRLMREAIQAQKNGDVIRLNKAREKLARLTPVTPAVPSRYHTPLLPTLPGSTPLRPDDSRELIVDVSRGSEARAGATGGGVLALREVELVDGRTEKVDFNTISLDQFQARYTSEDNASFARLHAAETEAVRQRQGWIEQEAQIHNDMLALPAESRHALMAHVAEPRNALMFAPEGVADQPTVAKEIRYRNTRFPTALQPGGDDSAAIADAQIAKRLRMDQEEYSRRIRADQAMEGQFHSRPELLTPIEFAKGRGILDTPILVAGEDQTPLITWGEIGSTPLLLSDAPGDARFDIQDLPKKDRDAHDLASRNARKKKSEKAARSEKVKEVVRMLTPARTGTPGARGRTPGVTPIAGTPLAGGHRSHTPTLAGVLDTPQRKLFRPRHRGEQ